MKVYIIHENDEWTLPLKLELKKLEVNFGAGQGNRTLYLIVGNDSLYQ